MIYKTKTYLLTCNLCHVLHLIFILIYFIRRPTVYFRNALKDCCSELRNEIPVELPCHVLYAILQQHFKEAFACNIYDVISEAEQHDYPLPIQYHEICKFAECVSSRMWAWRTAHIHRGREHRECRDIVSCLCAVEQ